MRRFLLTNLILVFALQSSGAAFAAPPVNRSAQRSFSAEITLAAAQLLNTAKATRIGALLTGSGDRYNAMHGPAPKRPLTMKSDPTTVMHHGLIRPTHRGEGIRGTPPAMLNRPLLPKDAAKLHLPATVTGGIKSASAVHAPAIDLIGALPTIPAPRPTRPSKGIHPLDVNTGTPNTTGINPWWTYEEGALPGVGKYMVNVANGNLIVQATDVDIPERGIDLAFRRTYNSRSLEDWNASSQSDDGSPAPGLYGTGWTNTFDAHLAPNSSGGVSVFDIDGARYDYTPNGTGCLTPPLGMHDTLCWDGGSGYLWTKKSGTIYYFYSPFLTGAGGYVGRLFEILGRNHNNYIVLYYYWANSDASNPANLTQIVAQHSDGQALTLSFGTINGKVLLSYITRPDGQQITYLYPNPAGNNNYGNLEEVDRPGNNQGTLKEQYGYYASNGFMNWVSSPRWFMTGSAEGAYTWFNYGCGNGSYLCGVQLYGYSNFVPSDGTGTAIQPAYSTGYQQIAYTGFTYSSGLTQISDVDGHATNWYFDGSGRVTQTQEWTGALWLVTGASWDANNNLTETVDARGYATDYAYDPNGNTVAVALPSVATNQGTFRPTSLYSYDRTNGANNVVEYCDPVETHSIGQDWTSNPGSSDSLCPNQSGATRYTWDYSDGSEPFGRLSNSYTPLGYHESYSYSSGPQGGDFGLPTAVSGDCISQNDGNNRCPTQSFAYDGYGNLASYNKGNGASSLAYDNLNRMTSVADADGVTSRTCYYANGQVSAKQSAIQFQMDGGSVCGNNSVSFTYDADGNERTELHHFGNVAGTTTKWYDGADRLVEVQLPSDAQDVYHNPWTTRYLYDLSQGGTVTYASHTFSAHGNLYKTQELLTSNSGWYAGSAQLNNNSFVDMKGTTFDALDRATTKYGPQQDTFSYDATVGTYGLLYQHCNALNACGTLTYDAAARTTQVSYNDGLTPTESTTYDADGRAVARNSSTFGAQDFSFDSDGRLTQSTEPSGGGVTSPATLTYHFYADGMRSSLDVSSSGLNQSGLFADSYRADGKIEQRQINLSSDSLVGTTTLSFTYTAAGRLIQRTESGPGANGSPITASYDINDGRNTGTRTALNYPAVNISAFSYDAEGELLGYQDSFVGIGCCTTQTFAYTTRGEEEADSREYVAPGTSARANFANGVVIAGTYSANSVTWDPVRGVVNGSFNPENSNLDPSTFAFDSAGRETGTNTTGGLDHYGNEYSYTKTRQYDAEDHIIGSSQTTPVNTFQSRNTYTTLTAYQWGPNGHPILVGSTPKVENGTPSTSQLAYDTLHWDGNQLLFTTNPQGQVDDIKIGSEADITPLDSGYAGLTFWDRMAGATAFCHNATGVAGSDKSSSTHTWSGQYGAGSTVGFGCAKLNGQTMQIPSSIVWGGEQTLAGGIGQGSVLGTPGTDGLADGVNIIQGVRAYDPQQGGWATPDAYAGEVDAPISQKSYVWNRSNPVSYSDPSGYSSMFFDASVGDTGATGVMNVQYDDGTWADMYDIGNATPAPMATVSSGLAVYTALSALALQAAATATDKAVAETKGPFSGDRDSFLKNLQAMVQSGLDWFGIKAVATVSLTDATVSVRAGMDRMSITGNANALQVSLSHDGNIHQNAIVVGSPTGAMVSWERHGSYGAPQGLTFGIHIHLQIKGVPMFDPYLSFGYKD